LAAIALPDDLNRDDADALGQFVGQSLRTLGVDGLPVLMDVPRGRAFLKPMQLPPVDDERELPTMVRYQVEPELPFAIEEAVIDFTVESHAVAAETAAQDEAATMPVLVAAVRRAVVDHYQQIAAAGGFKLTQLGLRPYADTRCLEACLPEERRAQTQALVHVTGEEVEINVVTGGLLVFSRSARAKRPAENATPTTESEATDATSVSPHQAARDALVMEVVRTLQSAAAVLNGVKVECIHVAGDTEDEHLVADALSRRLGIPGHVVEPVSALKIKRAKTDGRGFMTALGLAVGYGMGDRMPFNFVDPKRPPVQRDLRKLKLIGGGAAAAALVGMAILAGTIVRGNATSRFESLGATYNELEKKVKPIEKLRKRVDAIEKWQGESRHWLDHWAHISSLFPPAEDAYATNLKSANDGSINLNLRARSPQVITAMIKRLRGAGYDVQLGQQRAVTDSYGYGYETPLSLSFDRKMKVVPADLYAEPRPADDGSLQLISRRNRDDRDSRSSRDSSRRSR